MTKAPEHRSRSFTIAESGPLRSPHGRFPEISGKLIRDAISFRNSGYPSTSPAEGSRAKNIRTIVEVTPVPRTIPPAASHHRRLVPHLSRNSYETRMGAMKRFLQCTAALLMLGSSVGCCYVGGVCDPCTGIMFGGKWEPICGGPLDPCGWRCGIGCGVGCGPVAPPCGPTCGPTCGPACAPAPGPIVPPIQHGPDCGCHGPHGHHGHHGHHGYPGQVVPGPGQWHTAPGGPVPVPAPSSGPTTPAPVPEPMTYYSSPAPTQTAAISGAAPLLTVPAGLYGSPDTTIQSNVHSAGTPVQH